jgi:hypothetical protein
MNAVAHPDEHLAKAVRSFSTVATHWGGRPAGYYTGGGEGGLEGREVLDDTLFVRAAGLTLDRLGISLHAISHRSSASRQQAGRDLGRVRRLHWPRL